MAYVLLSEWGQHFPWLDVLDPAAQADVLEAASRSADVILGCEPLELRTVTGRRLRIRTPNPTGHTRYVWLPTWPPLEPAKWQQTLTSVAYQDQYGSLIATVPVAQIVQVPSERGLLIMPEPVRDGYWAQVTYTAGYDTATPTGVPLVLQEATLCLAQALVAARLGQRSFDELSESGVFKARARELLAPYAHMAVC